MNFEKGDKVKTRKDLTIGSPYGHCEFVIEMQAFAVRKVEIIEVDEKNNWYKIKEDGNTYCWDEKMFISPSYWRQFIKLINRR